MSQIQQLLNIVKEASCDIYKDLGAGYNETVYEEALAVEFRERKIKYDVEKNTEIFYKGIKVGIHRLDFIVEKKLVVELKAQANLQLSHVGQIRSYLKTLKLANGILVNFPYPDKAKPVFKQVTIL